MDVSGPNAPTPPSASVPTPVPTPTTPTLTTADPNFRVLPLSTIATSTNPAEIASTTNTSIIPAAHRNAPDDPLTVSTIIRTPPQGRLP
nr:unnamed protein product [Spirometra erinaceieuropaei]